jgi:hypothetical protein
MIVDDATTTTTTMIGLRAILVDEMMITYTMIPDTAAVMVVTPNAGTVGHRVILLETALDLEINRGGEAAMGLILT